jgi:hypothetical protein
MALPVVGIGFGSKAERGCLKFPPTLINRVLFQLDLACLHTVQNGFILLNQNQKRKRKL